MVSDWCLPAIGGILFDSNRQRNVDTLSYFSIV